MKKSDQKTFMDNWGTLLAGGTNTRLTEKAMNDMVNNARAIVLKSSYSVKEGTVAYIDENTGEAFTYDLYEGSWKKKPLCPSLLNSLESLL